MNRFTCGTFHAGFFFGTFHNFHSLSIAPVPTCLKNVTGIKFRISVYLQKSMLMRQNVKHAVFALCFKLFQTITICFIHVIHGIATSLESGLCRKPSFMQEMMVSLLSRLLSSPVIWCQCQMKCLVCKTRTEFRCHLRVCCLLQS